MSSLPPDDPRPQRRQKPWEGGDPDRDWPTPHRCRFVIVTTPRSGSYHLASLLGSAPDVTSLGELFKENAVELPPDWRDRVGLSAGMVAQRDADPRGYLERLLTLADRPIFGFKEFEARLNRVNLRKPVLVSRDWHKIFLTRNPIRKYISLERARQTGAYTRRDAAGLTDAQPVRFDAGLFQNVLETDLKLRRSMAKIADRMPDRVAVLDYRDLFQPARLTDALRFIGSSATADALTSSYQRQYAEGLQDGLADFDQMARHMRENGHSALLDDAALPDT